MRRQPSDLNPNLWIALAALLVLTLAPAVTAQEASDQERAEALAKAAERTVIKQTRYLDVVQAQAILQLLDVAVRIDPERSAFILRGGGADLESALRLIDALDEPPAASVNVELTAFILGASKQGSGGEVPAGLTPVVDRLRELFGYRAFTLVDAAFLRVRDGSPGEVEGVSGDDGEQNRYRLRFKKAMVIPQEGARILRLDDLEFHHGSQANLRTNVEVREGQKAVIGKATPAGGDGSLILVVEARILD